MDLSLKEDIIADILISGDTQLSLDNNLQFIVIEQNVLREYTDFKYFAFKFVYNKEGVRIDMLKDDEDMLEFYKHNLTRGFKRRENADETGNIPYFPKWIYTYFQTEGLKLQFVYKNKISNLYINV